MLKSFHLYNDSLDALPEKQLLITTLNAHSYNVACKDAAFAEALRGSDVLLPDGISVVWAARIFRRTKNQEPGSKILKKIAGEDLFYWEMRRLNNRVKNQEPRQERAKAFFLGSTEEVLAKIKERAGVEFPHVEVHTYSPPYKPEFSDEDNAAILSAIQAVQPDVLFVGMTAPKQEKWAMKLVVSSRQSAVNSPASGMSKYSISSRKYVVSSEEKGEEVGSRKYVVSSEEKGEEVGSREYVVSSEEKKEEEVGSRVYVVSSEETTNYLLPTTYYQLPTTNYLLPTINYQLPTNIHVCCIGAVFDFYAGTVQRAPQWIIKIHMEWFYRLVKEPRRMWRRYLVGNVKFVWAIGKEVFSD